MWNLKTAGVFNNRQRLITFLNMIEAPWYKSSNHLNILIADTRSEVNSRILGLPSVQSIEIQLPNETERSKFVQTYVGGDASALPAILRT